jgi:hypothetical protein
VTAGLVYQPITDESFLGREERAAPGCTMTAACAFRRAAISMKA